MRHAIAQGNMDKRQFSLLETEKLAGYIYALKDPRDRKVFYVGQGTKNSRVFEHFAEADKYINSLNNVPSSKIMRILDIWASDLDVEWMIISRGHDCENKKLLDTIESAVIDALSESQNGPALNAASGSHSTFLSKEDMVQIDALPVDPKNPYQTVFVFPIQRALANGEELYDATRKVWAVTDYYRKENNAIAVGIKENISLSSYRIKEWKSITDRKYAFVGEEYPEFKDLNWRKIISEAKGFWQYGNYLVVEFDGYGKFRFRRGNPDTGWRNTKELVVD